VYYQDFTDNTPIQFTNFLSLSPTEKFEDELFISNSFEVSRISELNLNHFLGKQIGEDEYSRPIYQTKLTSEKRFYIKLPEEYDYKSYWENGGEIAY
jgi:hypothetical protein